jgi:HSP20 family protein
MLLGTLNSRGIPGFFREFDRMERQLSNLFTGGPYGGEVFPELNIYRNEDTVKVSALLPGFDIEKLDVTVQGNRLTIKGEYAEEEGTKDAAASRRERFTGSFERSIRLPFRSTGDEVSADYKKGLLIVTVNRLEEDKPRRVAIEAN